MRHVKRLPLILFALLHLFAFSALAAEPPKEPILRIETGMHTATINRVATDSAGRWLVTASLDKSLRVWELPSGRVVRVIRPPIGEGEEGQLRAVALSPDGKTIACGGWTCLGSETGLTIYLFDSARGDMTARITGLPNVITHLTFSPDGRFLVASLGVRGIRLYRAPNWALAGKDEDYAAESYSAHFSGNGQLVTSCWDGFIRLYKLESSSLRLVAKIRAPGGIQPYSARFSPDNSQVAVGYADTNNVSVLSGRDLSPLFSPDVSGVHNDNRLCSVAWSADGRYLYAGGIYIKEFNGARKFLIRRWSGAGRGNYNDIPAANANIMDMRPLSDGRLAFGSADPAFGLLDRDGKETLFVPPSIADYRALLDKFLVSGDGATVSFGYEPFGNSPAFFDLGARQLTQGITAANLKAPDSTAPNLTIEEWNSTFKPKLNGVLLQLSQDYEMSRSLAVAPAGESFILGTDFALYRFDHLGRRIWRVTAPEAAFAVNVSGNGRIVVAALGDGTIRWYRMSDGKELLAFFPHADRKRWVLWTPSGYYDASLAGEELIGWHVNRGKDQAADFFPASRFRSTKYRPDVIAKVLETLDEDEAVRLANAASGRRQSPASIAHLLPPVVSITSPQDGANISSRNVTINYTLRAPGDAPVTGIRVQVDGRPIATERRISNKPKDGVTQSVTVTIPERDCEVSIIAENRNSASVPATVRLTWKGARPEEFTAKPKLYALAIGVSAYLDKELTLGYAAKDARDFSAALNRQKGGLYREVVVKTLTDATATKEDIMDGLEWLQKEVTSKDVGIIFIAGHGVNDSRGIYYYLPRNADPDRLMRTGVVFSDIKNTLNSLAGKAIMFVDTCHSGNIMGARRGVTDINAVVNELSSAENGVVVFASSTGRQYSLEDDQWGNGAFTKALVEGLNGKADYGSKGRITINMLDLYLAERVKELTRGQQTPTVAKPQTIPDFPIAVKR